MPQPMVTLPPDARMRLNMLAEMLQRAGRWTPPPDEDASAETSVPLQAHQPISYTG